MLPNPSAYIPKYSHKHTKERGTRLHLIPPNFLLPNPPKPSRFQHHPPTEEGGHINAPVDPQYQTSYLDRRVGPSVPDITLRSSDCWFCWLMPTDYDLFPPGCFSPTASLAATSGLSPVHYTQLDARVAPRYVRQTDPHLSARVVLLVEHSCCGGHWSLVEGG